MNKQQQRTFGITKNLLKKPIPKFYGAGDHKVQLAYITPDEANLLADLDLHGSNPPNPGPGGIPNFNDPGTGMSGAAASAAEAGSRATRAGAAQARAEGVGGFVTGGGSMVTGGGGMVTSGNTGIQGDGSTVNYGNNVGSNYGLGVSPNIGAGQPSDDTDKDGAEKTSFMDSIKQSVKAKFSPQGLLGTVIGTALFGPVGGFLMGNIAGTYGDDDESNNFFGNIGKSLQTDFSNTKDYFSNEEGEFSLGNLFDGVGNLFGPAAPMDPRDLRGDNRPKTILPLEQVTMDIDDDTAATEEDDVVNANQVLSNTGSFKFDPTTNSFGFRP